MYYFIVSGSGIWTELGPLFQAFSQGHNEGVGCSHFQVHLGQGMLIHWLLAGFSSSLTVVVMALVPLLAKGCPQFLAMWTAQVSLFFFFLF